MIERFLSKVSPEPNTGCWLWAGRTNDTGYGVFDLPGHDGPPALASRVSYELFVGPLGDLFALHRCDMPLCVNPGHLFKGTQQDNIDDMYRKGRGGIHRAPKGEESPNAKLTDSDVREIRATPKTWGSESRLAKRFGVSRSLIWAVRTRHVWRDA